MKINPFRPYEFWNDMDDFKVPYKLCGSLEREILIQRYNGLTNRKTWILDKRCHQTGW